MGALLESGLVGNIGLKHLKVIKEDTINKWDRLGFLDGLRGHLKENVAQLYENQASYLINEATSDGGSNGAFETVVFPSIFWGHIVIMLQKSFRLKYSHLT